MLDGITLIREAFLVIGDMVHQKATTALLMDIMPLIAAELADLQAIYYLPVYLQTKGVNFLANIQRLVEYRQ